MNSFTAFTHEVDDVSAAVSELLAQLDLGGKNKLLRHTIGIVSCYAEYLESGVWRALCDALPFELVGLTTISSLANGQLGETMLAVMVLTSDEVSFSIALSAPMTGEEAAPLHALYRTAREKLPGDPSLILAFSPLLVSIGSDFFVDCLSACSGNVPLFGALAVDHNLDYRDARVLLGGKAYRDRFAIVLLHGPVAPVFYVANISGERIFPEKGVVTDAEGNCLKAVDGMSALEYLRSLGLGKGGEEGASDINSAPILVDYNDGTAPVLRAMFAVTPEGHAVCGGNMPVGSTLSICSFDVREIVATSGRTLAQVLQAQPHRPLLMYSCIGRYFSQGYDPMAEFQHLEGLLTAAGCPYLAAYSGGELCPVYGKDGRPINRNHNHSLIICAL